MGDPGLPEGGAEELDEALVGELLAVEAFELAVVEEESPGTRMRKVTLLPDGPTDIWTGSFGSLASGDAASPRLFCSASSAWALPAYLVPVGPCHRWGSLLEVSLWMTFAGARRLGWLALGPALESIVVGLGGNG